MMPPWMKNMLPDPFRHQLYALLSLYRRQWRSMRTGMSMDPQGNPLPWYTFPAIDYLSGLDFSGKRVFEYGSGQSTLWWSERCRDLTSVEHDRDFYNRMNSKGKINARYICDEVMRNYVGRLESPQDVIVIDGVEREECAKRALRFLAPRGMIILDNSQVEYHATATLDKSRLFRVDFWGWVCVHGGMNCTSIYFDR
jgi:hypothetical protein